MQGALPCGITISMQILGLWQIGSMSKPRYCQGGLYGNIQYKGVMYMCEVPRPSLKSWRIYSTTETALWSVGHDVPYFQSQGVRFCNCTVHQVRSPLSMTLVISVPFILSITWSNKLAWYHAKADRQNSYGTIHPKKGAFGLFSPN